MTHLVILRSQLVQAFLDDVISVEVLDEHDDVQTKRDDNRVDLSIVSEISLRAATANIHRA